MFGIARLNTLAKAATAAAATYAVSFDGSGDGYYANLSSTGTSGTDSKYLTFACTFYWSGGSNLQHLANVRLGDTSSSQYGFWVWINGGRMQCKMSGGDGSVPTSIYENTENSLTTNAWNQVVIYWDTTSYTTNTKIYVNGSSKAISNEGTTNVNWNWGCPTANGTSFVKVGRLNAAQTGDGVDFNGRVAQLYIHGVSGAPTISNYWDSGSSLPKDLGTQGTATGLSRPYIYHYGDTTTFPTNNGTGFNSYTMTLQGDVATVSGPTYA
jgi:hypothetical protein